jgi:ABC-2 type transport system ATP-binding protein
MEEAERLCDRVAIVDHGRIIALGTPADLIASLNAPHIIEFATEPAVAEDLLARIPGVGDRRRRDGRWLLNAASLAEAVPAFLAALDGAGAKLVSLSTHRATLEDVFLAMTGRELRDE